MENKNIIVRIPEPCHEDWNKMTPDNKGKFCGSCQKSVFDFTNKTDEEIKDILMQYKDQKLCGHFKKSQIDRPLNIRVNLNDVPRNMSITKMFALAMLLTFGATLFGCYDLQGKKITGIEMINGIDEKVLRTTGEVAPMPEIKTEVAKDDSLKKVQCDNTVDGQMVVHEQYVNGGIGMQQIEPIIDSVYTVKTLPQEKEEVLMGKPSFTNEVKEITNKEEVLTKRDSAVEKVELYIFDDRRVLGGLIAVETVTEEVIEPQNTTTNSVESGNTIIKENSFVVYPNPGKGDFTIKYEVLKRSEVRVDILDVQGKFITNISDIAKQYEGKYEIPVSLDVPNGIYFVSIIADGKKNTSRVVVER